MAKYELLVDFLDEDGGAGWELLGLLIAGETGALELTRHRFLARTAPSGSAAARQKSAGTDKGGSAGLGGLRLPWQK